MRGFGNRGGSSGTATGAVDFGIIRHLSLASVSTNLLDCINWFQGLDKVEQISQFSNTNDGGLGLLISGSLTCFGNGKIRASTEEKLEAHA